jgi:hypothetical protein
MSDERFEEFLQREARRYHEPPEVPREAMWRAMAETRRAGRHRTRRPTWIYWGAGIAAALVVGVGIGRYSAPTGESETLAATEPTAATEARGIPAAFRLTTAEHLARVEVFLMGFRADARSGVPVAAASPDARNLLATTRLLMDSPVSQDVMLQQLLEDIELVLTQIASYAGEAESGELELIDESLDQRSVLFRLHAVTDADPAGAPLQGVL